jgi:hypothetical protein
LTVSTVLNNQRTGFNIEPQFYKDFYKELILKYNFAVLTNSKDLIK